MSSPDFAGGLRILLVEDNEADADLVADLLGTEVDGVTIEHTTRLRQAADLVERESFDCVLLDLGLPDSQGIDTLAGLRANTATVPVIVLTGRDDEALGLEALRQGAQDYLVKGQVDGRSLRRAVRYAIERRALDEAKSQFIARAAHELRTPLAVLAGLGETVATRFQDLSVEQLSEILSALDRQAKRARTLIAQLLDLSQAELGGIHLRPERLDAAEIVAAVVEAAPPPPGVEVTAAIDPALYLVGDRTRMEQVLTNLVTNAYKYGGRSITISAQRLATGVAIAVADDGPGVADNVRPHLFEPFMRGAHSGSTEGAGLGLAISRRLATALNGDLTLEDSPTGARFVLTLPA